MKIKMLIGAMALTLSGAAFAAEPAEPAAKKECCCKKGEDGKMACCKDKDGGKAAEKSGHEGHDMGDMKSK